MARKPVTLNLDDDPPRVVYGKWLRVIGEGDSDYDGRKDVAIIEISKINAFLTRECGGCIIDFKNDGRVYVTNYSPDQMLKIIADAEFSEALEKTLGDKK